MDEVKITGFEEIKQNLINNGFEFSNNMFTKEQCQVQTIVLNGQPLQRELKNIIKFEYLPDCWIENSDGTHHEDMYGFNIYHGDDMTGTFYVRSWMDFIEMIRI